MKKIIVKNVEEMDDLGREVAAEVLKERPAAGAVVLALEGDLGAGKTTFAKAFAKALGIKVKITSPTFLILKRFNIQHSFFKNFYHIDAYRLKSSEEILGLGFSDALKNSKNIILIEWADKIKDILPGSARWIRFRHGENQSEREIEVR